jgi:uncharacterized membrane protein YfcA
MLEQAGIAFYSLAVLGVLLTGISKSGFAGGAGVVAVPLLALVMPIPLAVALMLPLLIVMDVKTIWFYRHTFDTDTLKRIVPAALFGILLVGSGFALLSETVLQASLAVFSMLFASWQNLIPYIKKLPGSALIWGCLSGISSTLLHAGGPPINVYLISRQLQKAVWLGSAAIFFGIMNLTKVIPYTLNHQWNSELFYLDLLLFPVALIGVSMGKWLQHTLDELWFIYSCRILLFFSGLLLLIKL